MEAAEILAQQPSAMQLRYLQTLTQVAGDKSSTLVFPVPVDLLNTLMSGKGPVPATLPGTPPAARGNGAPRVDASSAT
jgi:hypothetical protein